MPCISEKKNSITSVSIISPRDPKEQAICLLKPGFFTHYFVRETSNGQGLLKQIAANRYFDVGSARFVTYFTGLARLLKAWKFILSLTPKAHFDRIQLLSILRKINRYSAKRSTLQFFVDEGILNFKI